MKIITEKLRKNVMHMIIFVIFLANIFPLCDQVSWIKLCSCSFSKSWKFNLVSSSLMDTFWPFNWRRSEIIFIVFVPRSTLYFVFSSTTFMTGPTMCAASTSISCSFTFLVNTFYNFVDVFVFEVCVLYSK